MELECEDRTLLVLERGELTGGSCGDSPEVRRAFNHAVLVAHPDLAWKRHPFPKRGIRDSLELRLAELANSGVFDHTSKLAGHELVAVAKAKDRQVEVQQIGVEHGRVFRKHRGRASGEDESSCIFEGGAVGDGCMDLGVESEVAQALIGADAQNYYRKGVSCLVSVSRK